MLRVPSERRFHRTGARPPLSDALRAGPVNDLQWWTGWNRIAVRRALDGLPVDEIDLHGQPGITLRADHTSAAVAAVDTAATQLQERLGAASVTSAVRSPLERSISDMT